MCLKRGGKVAGENCLVGGLYCFWLTFRLVSFFCFAFHVILKLRPKNYCRLVVSPAFVASLASIGSRRRLLFSCLSRSFLFISIFRVFFFLGGGGGEEEGWW